MTQDAQSMILRPKKSSAIWLLLISAIFVGGGIWMGQEQGWIGYLSDGFFATGIPVPILQLLPGSTYLQITNDGLSFANMFRVTEIPWNVIDHFFVVSLKQTGITVHKMVGFNFVPSYDRAHAGRRITYAIGQCEAALPNKYGKKAEELAKILNRYLSEFTKKTGEQMNQSKPE